MLMADPELEATFPGTPPGVTELRHAVAEVARRHGLPASTVDAARLAASEAASNAVVHAYRDRPGDLRLLARVQDGELHLVIADEGGGMAPRTDSPGLGLGLPLIRQTALDLDVRPHPAGGTEVLMRFELSGTRVS
jgi:serine/threonine-protein kinase RsbW